MITNQNLIHKMAFAIVPVEEAKPRAKLRRRLSEYAQSHPYDDFPPPTDQTIRSWCNNDSSPSGENCINFLFRFLTHLDQIGELNELNTDQKEVFSQLQKHLIKDTTTKPRGSAPDHAAKLQERISELESDTHTNEEYYAQDQIDDRNREIDRLKRELNEYSSGSRDDNRDYSSEPLDIDEIRELALEIGSNRKKPYDINPADKDRLEQSFAVTGPAMNQSDIFLVEAALNLTSRNIGHTAIPNPDRAGNVLREHRFPLLYVSGIVNAELTQLEKKVRQSNRLDTETKEKILLQIDRICDALRELSVKLDKKPEELEQEPAESWGSDFSKELRDGISELCEAKHLASITIPTGLIFGCGALGALLGGPVGFGAGSVFGHLLSGQMKPGAATQKLEDEFNSEGQN